MKKLLRLSLLVGLVASCHLDQLFNASNSVSGPTVRLVFTAQPQDVGAGTPITPAVQVTVQDQAGNPLMTFDSPVTIAIGTNPSGGKLLAATTATPVNGVATFSNVRIDKVGSGYTLTAGASGVSDATSNAFAVTPGPARRLVFTVQPSGATPNDPIAPPVQVTAYDSIGNKATNFAGVVTIGIGHNGGTLKAGKLSGGRAAPAVNGVATFSDLSIDQVGNGYTLNAAFGTNAPVVESASFNVTALPRYAVKLGFLIQPSVTQVGAAIAPPVQVAALDADGNPVSTDVSVVTVAIGTNPGGGALTGTRIATEVNGVATFSDLRVDKTGVGYTLAATANGLTGATSAPFNITAVPPVAKRLAFFVQPSTTFAGVAIAPAVRVIALDSTGNPVTTYAGTVTVSLGANPGGSTLSGLPTVNAVNGVATFSDLRLSNKGAGYTLVAAATALASATSTPFDITVPIRVAFVTQPRTTPAGSAIAPPVQVAVMDSAGNTATAYSGTVIVALSANVSGGILGGTPSAPAVNGVATFSDLRVDKTGSAYTLNAAASGLMPASSAPFDITPVAVATRLAFQAQPVTTQAGATIAPPVRVAALGSDGNTVTTYSGTVTIALGAHPVGSTLGGAPTATAVNGVATFADLSIAKAAAGYTLTAAAGALAGATSTAFDITPGPASALAFTVQPSNTRKSLPIQPPVQVTAYDAFGNVVATFAGSVHVAIGTDGSLFKTAVLGGTATVPAAGGVATFSGLTIDQLGTGYTLTAAFTGNPPVATSAAFNITP